MSDQNIADEIENCIEETLVLDPDQFAELDQSEFERFRRVSFEQMTALREGHRDDREIIVRGNGPELHNAIQKARVHLDDETGMVAIDFEEINELEDDFDDRHFSTPNRVDGDVDAKAKGHMTTTVQMFLGEMMLRGHHKALQFPIDVAPELDVNQARELRDALDDAIDGAIEEQHGHARREHKHRKQEAKQYEQMIDTNTEVGPYACPDCAFDTGDPVGEIQYGMDFPDDAPEVSVTTSPRGQSIECPECGASHSRGQFMDEWQNEHGSIPEPPHPEPAPETDPWKEYR